MKAGKVRLAVFVFFLMAAGMTASLFMGRYPLSFHKLLEGDAQEIRIFMVLRLPRTLMAVLGGYGLGVSGAVFQAVLQNPLASPDVLGAASGASAGAAFGILFLGAMPAAITAAGFFGALAAVGVALLLACFPKNSNPMSIVVAGIAVHAAAQAILMLLKLSADPEKELASVEYWMMGSLSGITINRIFVPGLVSVFGIVGCSFLYRQIQVLSLGEEQAKALGMEAGIMKIIILVFGTMVVGSVISVTGLISFVSLIAPHIARMLWKFEDKTYLRLSGLTGAELLLLSDLLVRGLFRTELPVSVVTSLFGAPFLLGLLLVGRERL